MSGTDQAILYAQGRGGLDDFKGSTSDEAILHAQNNGSLEGFKQQGSFAGPSNPTDGLSAALGDTDGINSYMSKFRGSNSVEAQELRRRATFLDSSGDSLVAMDNVAKGMGMGRGFANVDGEAVAMSSGDRRKILQAAPGETQKFKDDWMKAKLAAKSEEQVAAESPATAQNPDFITAPKAADTGKATQAPGVQPTLDYMQNNSQQPVQIGGAPDLNEENFKKNGIINASFEPQKFYLQ